MNKIIINVGLSGMVPTKEMNSNVPISPREMIEDALKLAKLGASVIHLHPRDEEGKPTWKKEVFAEIIKGIREKNKDVIISVSCTGRFWNEFEKRADVLDLEGDLKPDLASLTVGSFNFMKDMSINSPKIIKELALKMVKNGIKPELEIFEQGMIHKAKYLMEKGIISKEKPYFNLFFGSLGAAPLEASSVASFLSILPEGAIWSMAGIGSYQMDANVLGLALGGNVRVGLEDNLYYDRERKVLASNEMYVERIIKIASDMGLEIATAKQARETLGLNQ